MEDSHFMKFLLCVILICFTLTLVGCRNETDPPSETEITNTSPTHKVINNKYQTFTADGIEFTLPIRFQEYVVQGRTIYWDKYSQVMFEREPFTEHFSLSGYSLEEYGQLLIESRNMNCSLHVIDDLLCFEYEVDLPDGTARYNYFVVLYKTDTDFWIVEFVSDSREAQLHRDEFIEWAKMVQFADQQDAVSDLS